MANKFQKSVFERLEQESSRQKKIQPSPIKDAAGSNPDSEQTTMPVNVEKAMPERSPNAKDNSISAGVERLPADIGAFLRPVLQRQAKNKTFYLDGDVIIAIKTTAKAQGVTDSKLVNDILRRVLDVEERD